MKDRITIGYCSQTRNIFFENKIRQSCGLEVDIIPKIGYDSMCKAYNEVIDESENDLIVLCHNDIEMVTYHWGVILNYLFNKNTDMGICGVVGSTSFSGDSWAGDGGVGLGTLIQMYRYHVKKDTLLLFSPKYQNNDVNRAVTCDGLFIACKKSMIKKRFDENIPGFHFYDVCFTVDNHLNGVNVYVTNNILIKHHSDGAYNNNWKELHDGYIKEKYKGLLPIRIPMKWGGEPAGEKWRDVKKKELLKKVEELKKCQRI